MAKTTVNEARAKLTAKIGTMSDDMILEALPLLDSDKMDELIVRVELLREWEVRHGGESVDKVMDSLEAIEAR